MRRRCQTPLVSGGLWAYAESPRPTLWRGELLFLAFNCGPTLEGARYSETPVRVRQCARMWQAGTAGPKLRAVFFCGCQKQTGHMHTRNNKNTQWGRRRQNTLCLKQLRTFTGWGVLTAERGMGVISATWDEHVNLLGMFRAIFSIE